jgi:maltooligosyltrehalose trehalohydrolase
MHRTTWIPSIGAWREGGLTTFRVWAPDRQSVDLILEGDRRPRPLAREEDGHWSGRFSDIVANATYRYRLDGRDEETLPDPASRFQPRGVHGPSQVIDPTAFRWSDHGWRPPRRESIVFYELHVGTFSPDGTFGGVVERLPYLAQLGVTSIELMPLGDFSGDRNWGYDGVAIFAPARCYGTPDDLRRLVDAAHQHGLAVCVDVVYNHLGPDGAYANAFSPYYFSDRHNSPWGRGVNLDGRHSRAVRDFFIQNALHWVLEYHVDALRLDATHALQDEGRRHFLEELTSTVRERAGRSVMFVAEDHRNLAGMLRPACDDGWGIDGVWADDFHHQVRVHSAGDREGYYQDFTGTTADLAATIRQGWFFTGQPSQYLGERRGTDPTGLSPRQFVVCIQNHDQVGNRSDGARLNHQVDAAVFRAISVLLLTVPQTPLLFMGQEWAATTPFLYFTDHHDELGRQITEGRREEFGDFEAFCDPCTRATIPDPQARDTLDRSRLHWDELTREPHISMLRLYQRLLGLRRTLAPLRMAKCGSYDVCAVNAETVALRLTIDQEQVAVIVRLGGAGSCSVAAPGTSWHVVLTTEDADLTDDPHPIQIACGATLETRFARPGAVIVRRLRS